MTGVDVLAVLDRLVGHARTLAATGDPAIRESIRQAAEARAAVAELIEAATEARKIIGMAVIGNTLRAAYRDNRAKPALHALDDALAKVQGGNS